MNLELIQYFWLSIAAGTLGGLQSALVGCHINAKDQSVQTLCLSQGAALGVLLGLLALAQVGPDHGDGPWAQNIIPWITSFLSALAITTLLNHLVRNQPVAKNTHFIAAFSLLIAANSLLTRLFPGLESHFTQVFFGDLATLTDADAMLVTVLSLLFFVVFLRYWRTYSMHTFEWSLFGREGLILNSRHKAIMVGYEILVLALTCFWIQKLGFLFTLAQLFLPTILIRALPIKHIQYHFLGVGLLTLISVPSGFAGSLVWSDLPTVPTILWVETILGLLLIGGCRLTRR
jgi:ABC-type Mn2+/Zn2+ transport system permease subunit